jgi:predicted DNA-binding transcriptional regulator YafY
MACAVNRSSTILVGSYDPWRIVTMPPLKEEKRLSKLERCYGLAATLMSGGALDRNVVAAKLGISPANADRHLRAIKNTMLVTPITGKDGLTSIRATSGTKAPATATVVAACFGASLARLFHETPFEQRLRDMVTHVLEGVRDIPKYKDRERQFLFVSRGGERALRRNGSTVLDEVVDAILQRRVLRLRHTKFSGKPETIYLKALSLALHEHQLYVLGLGDRGLRNIRFSRITAALKMKESFEYPTLDEYDPRLVFRDSVGIFIHDDEAKGIRVRDVKLRLSSHWASYVETHRWHESQRHTLDKQGVLLEFRVRTCPELERLILGFGDDAEVIEPPELRAKIAMQTAAMARRYRTRRRKTR